MIQTLLGASIQSSETVEHLTGSGLFGVFILLLAVVGLEKWTSYCAQKDRLKAEESRIERNEQGLMETRRLESESRDRLTEALNNIGKMTEINSVKIDEMSDDLKTVADKVGEHTIQIDTHTNQIAELRKRGTGE